MPLNECVSTSKSDKIRHSSNYTPGRERRDACVCVCVCVCVCFCVCFSLSLFFSSLSSVFPSFSLSLPLHLPPSPSLPLSLSSSIPPPVSLSVCLRSVCSVSLPVCLPVMGAGVIALSGSGGVGDNVTSDKHPLPVPNHKCWT